MINIVVWMGLSWLIFFCLCLCNFSGSPDYVHCYDMKPKAWVKSNAIARIWRGSKLSPWLGLVKTYTDNVLCWEKSQHFLYTTTARMCGKKDLLQVFLLGHAGLLCDCNDGWGYISPVFMVKFFQMCNGEHLKSACVVYL